MCVPRTPGARSFIYEGGVVSETSWDTTFTMDQENPESHIVKIRDPKEFQVNVRALGKVQSVNGKFDSDLFWFIAQKLWSYSPSIIPKPSESISEIEYSQLRQVVTVYVGKYNVRTRTGECLEMPLNDFLEANPHIKAVMLP